MYPGIIKPMMYTCVFFTDALYIIVYPVKPMYPVTPSQNPVKPRIP